MTGSDTPAASAPAEVQPPPVLSPPRPSGTLSATHTSPMTEAALASIVEVRQPIRPEFAPGGLVALIPSLVIAALVVMLVIAGLVLISHEMFGPFSPLSLLNPFARRF